jgi:hypothetical protein
VNYYYRLRPPGGKSISLSSPLSASSSSPPPNANANANGTAHFHYNPADTEPAPELSTLAHVLITSALVLSATAISLLICDLGVVFEIVGATSACVLAYILPPMCFIKLSGKGGWEVRVAKGVVVFGVCVGVGSVGGGIWRAVSGMFLDFLFYFYFRVWGICFSFLGCLLMICP